MRRRLFKIASCLSLALLAATAALWVRSYVAFDLLHHGTRVRREGAELIVRDWYIESASGAPASVLNAAARSRGNNDACYRSGWIIRRGFKLATVLSLVLLVGTAGRSY